MIYNYSDLVLAALAKKASSGGSGGEAAEIERVFHGTSDTTFSLPPNQFHVWGQVSTLTLTLSAGDGSNANIYWFAFDSGDTATELSLPQSVNTDIIVQPNTHYECSIVDNYMAFDEWTVSG